jgi:pyroglutamyl-peptidase
MKPRLLITGFEPFHGARVNPSAELIRDLSWLTAEAEVTSCLIPVDYKTAWPVLKEAIHTSKPDLIVQLGQASGRSSISLERIAINWKQERGADTGAVGEQSKDISVGEKIAEDGPDGIFSTFPIDAMLKAGKQSGVACEISNSAGTFLCNYVFYKTLLEFRFSSRRIGFIHLPLLPEQLEAGVVKPTMSLGQMKKCLNAMISVAVRG